MKVVTAKEMGRIEAWAVERGASLESFMDEAGRKVALAVQAFGKGKRIAIFAGKGNNGGDGFAAGIHLMKAGYEVKIFPLYPEEECSPLNQTFRNRFERAGGQIEGQIDWHGIDLIVDALLGTGFHGELEPLMEKVIRKANELGKPIVAIDIPSGLNGSTGEVGSVAVQATETVALGFAKIGFFIRNGWKWVGKLRVENFGLSPEAMKEARGVATIPELETLSLPPIERTRHKYSRGFVVGFGGSKEFQGAPKLSGLAALHSGAGIVKVFSLEAIGPASNELICQVWIETAWNEAIKKAQAVFVGPGMGRSRAAKEWMEKYFGKIEKPCVVDADALFFLTELEKWPSHSILTPHRGEMMQLLGEKGMEEELFFQKCQEFVEARDVVLVLKGAPTFVFKKGELPVIVTQGDPGMATAGSGDVLTGVIAALIAQGKECYEGAILGVALHGLAGEIAAEKKTSYGYTASDLIDFLPEAFKLW